MCLPPFSIAELAACQVCKVPTSERGSAALHKVIHCIATLTVVLLTGVNVVPLYLSACSVYSMEHVLARALVASQPLRTAALGCG
jgi:hypothetical protein